MGFGSRKFIADLIKNNLCGVREVRLQGVQQALIARSVARSVDYSFKQQKGENRENIGCYLRKVKKVCFFFQYGRNLSTVLDLKERANRG